MVIDIHRFRELTASCLRGAGQVMFQESALAGALFIMGILVGSLGWGGGGHLAVFEGAGAALLLATVGAFIVKLSGRQAGLWGFNAILVGCAAYTLLSVKLPIGVFAACCLLTIPLKWVFDKVVGFTSISSLTFPFIVATWILLYAAKWMGVAPYQPESIVETHEITAVSLIVGWLKGVSEVFLIDSWITGLLFLIGLWLSSRAAAAWAAVGSALGICYAMVIGAPKEEILLGLWGYSPALTAIAVGVVFKPESVSKAVWGIATIGSILVTGVLQQLFVELLSKVDLPVLTLPFCAATWLVMASANWVISGYHIGRR